MKEKYQDIKSVGLIAVKLKERHTGLQYPTSLILQEPENASVELKNFIRESASGDTLLHVREFFKMFIYIFANI